MLGTNALAGAAALGAGIAAGVYANFSLRVMPRLAALADPDGIRTMQSFNRTAEQAPFMAVFFGTALASGAVIARATDAERTTGDLLAAAGGGLYLAGFLLTIVYNVPRNNALAAADPVSAHGAQIWASYLREWTAANSVRAVMSAVGAAGLAAGTLTNILHRS